MTNNTIPNVPRDLLERVLYLMDNYIGTTHTEEDELRALLSAPSPAGVDGLEVVGYVSQDDIKWKGDCTLRIKPYSDYTIPLCRLSEAQAIIDGLLGENEALHDQVKVLQSDANSWQSGYDEGRRMGGKHCTLTIDQQAQRIGELEGLLQQSYQQVNSECMDWAKEYERRKAVQEERDSLISLLREFAVGISKREMPTEQELNGWFDRIDAALSAVCVAALNIATTSEHSGS